MASKIVYDFNLLDSFFTVSNTSPTGLVTKDNQVTGSFDYGKNGEKKSIRVKLGKTRYLAHRVVWVLINGKIDNTLDIDHIDGNPWNNRQENLRLVPKLLNQRNRKRMSNNKTGYNGVGIHTTATGSGKFNTYVRACWVDMNGKQIHKDFNIKNFESVEDASEFAELYRRMNIEDSTTYTERHGNQ